jgi:hypothetical protein
MRTRLDAGAQETNLAQELGLSPGALRMADMRDGLLAFEAQEDAERCACSHKRSALIRAYSAHGR